MPDTECVSINIFAFVIILLELLDLHHNRQSLIWGVWGSENNLLQTARASWSDIDKDKRVIGEVGDLAALDPLNEIYFNNRKKGKEM